MNKEEKEKKFDIKELFTNKQYRSILILGFYAILFIALVASIRINNHSTSSNRDNNSPTPDIDSVIEGYELINNNNFAYKYIVILDDRTITYDGRKYENKEEFLVSDGENERTYYINNDDVFIKDGETYTKSIKPYFVIDFFNTSVIESIINEANTSDDNVLTIDNQVLYNLIGEYNRSINEGSNTITLLYRNSHITKIVLDLSSYSRETDNQYDTVIITLEYYDFDLIDEIEG